MRRIILLTLLCSVPLLLNVCQSTGEDAESGQPTAEKKPAETGTDRGSATGCVAGDCQNGTGTYVWPSGSKYVGQFSQGLRNGTGTYTWSDGSEYVGQYVDGKRNGKGAYTWPNGESYVGEFVDDRKQGKGVYTWPNGTIYEGTWKDDKPDEGEWIRTSKAAMKDNEAASTGNDSENME